METAEQFAVDMDDGTLTIFTFATRSRSPTLPPGASWIDEQSRLWHRPATDNNVRTELNKAFPGRNQLGIRRPAPVAWRPISAAVLPQLRDFRNAWEYKDGKVVENLDRAREVHRDKLRVQRTARLLDLDIEWTRAMAAHDAQAADAVERRRQALRDLPDDPRIAAAKSVDELRQIRLPE